LCLHNYNTSQNKRVSGQNSKHVERYVYELYTNRVQYLTNLSMEFSEVRNFVAKKLPENWAKTVKRANYKRIFNRTQLVF